MIRRVYECKKCPGFSCRIVQLQKGGMPSPACCQANMHLVSKCEIPDDEEQEPKKEDPKK